jgi:hypothetical protein
MAIGLTVRDVHRHLGDLALTREEAEEIVNAVLAHRSRAELEAEALAGAVEVSRLLRLLADQWSCDDLTQVTSA